MLLSFMHSPMLKQIEEVKVIFAELSFTHIFRELNCHAGNLSKDALLLQEGTLSEQVFRDGTLHPATELHLY